ncbi:MAG: multiheme c-type cytochrome [Planctomycetaceae bacterium]
MSIDLAHRDRQNVRGLTAATVLALAMLADAHVVRGGPDRGPEISEETASEFCRRNGAVFEDWPRPAAVLVLTGELDGYIEPCGCSGKENQKGGLSRRHNLLIALEQAGWPTVALDLGNQVRRYGRQSEVKFQSVADGLRTMGYAVAGFGPFDVRLPVEELIAAAASIGDAPSPFVSANVGLLGLDSGITSRVRRVEAGGVRFGVTTVLACVEATRIHNDSIDILDPDKALTLASKELDALDCDHRVLLSWATPDETLALAEKHPSFKLVVSAGAADEPPMNPHGFGDGRLLIELGHKGMYAVVVGLFDDPATPIRTQRVPLDARWGEYADMIRLLGAYQRKLESLGLSGLGLIPGAARHPSGRRFAGSEGCAECHAHAYEIWRDTPHASALTTLEEQVPGRSHDPECLSCHVVGWAPQRVEPFDVGFVDTTETPHLAHNGCENCHGPAAAHAAVERGEVKVADAARDRLRQDLAMSLSSPEEKEKVISNCLECHDLDNSPHFDFGTYWPMVEHSEPEKIEKD